MEWTNAYFAGYECIQIKNEALSLWVTQAVGPRIIGLAVTGGENLLAVLPEAATVTPAGKRFHFRGGHRLWYAPEDAERTYAPDDAPVKVTAVSPHKLTFTPPPESLTGIQKQITITLPDESATVFVDHMLTNGSDAPIELAPWAITQLRPGGIGILPLSQVDTGLLPNRRLALWPYTPINSPHLKWSDQYIFVQAAMQTGKLKIGWENRAGWLGYWLGGTLFVKQAAYVDGADYYDFGSSSECFCEPHFLELETIAPRTTLAPNASVVHREVWRLYEVGEMMVEETAVNQMVERLGIG